MILYPYNSPIILNDSVFVAYGGQVGDHTVAQLEASYRVAEQQATNYVGTFLRPTIVTGTHPASFPRIVTDYGYIHRILSVSVKSVNDYVNCTLKSDAACAFIWEDTFGYIDVSCVLSQCGCGPSSYPYQIQIAYEAGLPTGTSTQPPMLLGLTMAAQITLNEIKYPSANESAGDIGVTAFSSMNYSEQRKDLKTTAFGNSAKANKVAQLIDSAVPRKARPALIL